MDQKNLIKIGVGVLVALLTGVIGLLFHQAKKQQDFREAWEIDEATEETQMFKDAREYERTMMHIEAIDPVKIKEIEINQRITLETLQEIKNTVKHQDSVNTLNADQIYQIKEEIKYKN